MVSGNLRTFASSKQMNDMDRYCKIPVTEMTNKDKIHAMVHRMNIMGSTHVWPEFGTHAMAFEYRRVGVAKHMWLYDIDANNVMFCPEDEERTKKEGKPCPDYGNIWEMPLHWFSESHLYQILVTFKYACKRSLMPEAYAEVINEIGETPETDNVFIKD